MDDTHPSILLLLSIIMILGIVIAGFYFGLIPSLVGNLIAEAGNSTRLDISVNKTTVIWGGVYGSFTTNPLDNNFTAIGGGIVHQNLSVSNPSSYLLPNETVFASYQGSINSSLLVAALPSELDTFLGLPPDDIRSATLTFTNQTNFTVGNTTILAFSTHTNSPVQKFDVGLLKDIATGNFVFVSHVIPGGTAFNGDSADFQIMLPVPSGILNYSFFTNINSDEFQIVLYPGQNWFSNPLELTNKSIASSLQSIGKGVGLQHELWPGQPGCTGNASDNYVGNYTAIWTYNATDLADPWKDFNPTKPCHQIPTQQIQEIRKEINYQIEMSVQDVFSTTGQEIQSPEIDLITGINWVGYPSLSKQNVSIAMDTVGIGKGVDHQLWSGTPGCTGDASDNYVGNYTVIWTYNATDLADPWKDFNPTKPCHQMPAQQIKKLIPGRGYQIYVIADETWIIP